MAIGVLVAVALVAIPSAATAQSDSALAHRSRRLGTGAPSSLASDRAAAGPATFIANHGQWHSDVRFLLRRPGLDTWITDDGAVFDVSDSRDTIDNRGRGPKQGRRPHRRRGQVIRMSLEGASAGAVPIGVRHASGLYHYFIGSDTTRWATHVPAFYRVLTEDVYPGIDIVHYVDEGSPRYDLVVRPGARPSAITLKITGARRLLLDSAGDLRMESTIGDLVQGRPVAYQLVGDRRVPVACGFDERDSVHVRFQVGAYDTTRPLVIDPIVFSTFLGGTAADHAHGVVTDAGENVYVVGYVLSADYPTTTGAYDVTDNPSWDAVVTKLDRSGATLGFSTYFGGNSIDLGTSIAIGDTVIAICGNTFSTDLPTAGGYQTTLSGNQNVFVATFSADGSALRAATYLGGDSADWSNGIAIASSGSIAVGGGTRSASFPTSNAAQGTIGGGDDGFVALLAPALDALGFSTFAGSSGNDYVDGIAIDGNDAIHASGGTSSTGFVTTTDGYDRTQSGGVDAFYRRYGANGSLAYSSFLGGAGDDRSFAIACDAAGAAWLTGYTSSTDFPVTSGVAQSTLGGAADAFVTRFTASGTVSSSTYLGGSAADTAYAIAIDAEGRSYVCGVTRGSFTTVAGSDDTDFGGEIDGFLSVVASGATSLAYSTYLGDAQADRSDAVAVIAKDRAVVVGSSASDGFPTTIGAYDRTRAGDFDMTVTRLYTVVSPARQPIAGIVNDYFAVYGFEECGECVYLEVPPAGAQLGLAAGDRALVMQMTGATFVEKNERTYGTIEGYGRSGLYEFATVLSITPVTVEGHNALCVRFTAGLVHDYTQSYQATAQLVRVPQYGDVEVTGGDLLTMPWNGSTGGVVALEASGTVYLTDDVDASGAGFAGGDASPAYTGSALRLYDYILTAPMFSRSAGRGEGIGRRSGTYSTDPWVGRGPSVSGGGGGNTRAGGGGGGSHVGAGGDGGWQALEDADPQCPPATVGGLGGRALVYDYIPSNRVYMGGGGGGGHVPAAGGLTRTGGAGGAGGGIVIIRAAAIAGSATMEARPWIVSDGEAGGDSRYAGAGGGGAGGALVLAVPYGSIAGFLGVSVDGAAGGRATGTTSYCYGTGGGGGGGYMRFGPDGVNLDSVAFERNGGAAGVSWSATALAPYQCAGTYAQSYGATEGGPGANHFGALVVPGTPMPISALPVFEQRFGWPELPRGELATAGVARLTLLSVSLHE